MFVIVNYGMLNSNVVVFMFCVGMVIFKVGVLFDIFCVCIFDFVGVFNSTARSYSSTFGIFGVLCCVLIVLNFYVFFFVLFVFINVVIVKIVKIVFVLIVLFVNFCSRSRASSSSSFRGVGIA